MIASYGALTQAMQFSAVQCLGFPLYKFENNYYKFENNYYKFINCFLIDNSCSQTSCPLLITNNFEHIFYYYCFKYIFTTFVKLIILAILEEVWF